MFAGLAWKLLVLMDWYAASATEDVEAPSGGGHCQLHSHRAAGLWWALGQAVSISLEQHQGFLLDQAGGMTSLPECFRVCEHSGIPCSPGQQPCWFSAILMLDVVLMQGSSTDYPWSRAGCVHGCQTRHAPMRCTQHVNCGAWCSSPEGDGGLPRRLRRCSRWQ